MDELEKAALGYRIVTWVGIIEQLSRTMANRAISDIGLPWPQFVLLNHFSHRPDQGKTVTAVARAMQQNQPGITKTLKAMVDAGLLHIVPDSTDGRIKRHFITDIGRARHQEAVARLSPMIGELFAEWSTDELIDTFHKLDRLKRWLDNNRR